MHTQSRRERWFTGLCVVAILVLCVVQISLVMRDGTSIPQISVNKSPVAYGYPNGVDGCKGGSANGIYATFEGCDDGDGSGDGCTSSCVVETGWTCTTTVGVISSCTPICGNGALHGSETCDDSNTTSGDGCSSSCAIETGFVCPTAGAACTRRCGDGIQNTGEACDDGNGADGDGCKSDCTVESGWSCSGSGEILISCSTSCGDGIKTGAEQCDTGGSISNSAACRVGCITATCGDGYWNAASGGEACDPTAANSPEKNQCSINCAIITSGGGMVTTESSSSSGTRRGPPVNCGNGVTEPTKGEECDRGLYNGLSPSCSRWCTYQTCGDGVVNYTEECEPEQDADGNYIANSCGRICAAPVCVGGVCNGGCTYRFLPACMVGSAPSTEVQTSSASAQESASFVAPEQGSASSETPLFGEASSEESSEPEPSLAPDGQQVEPEPELSQVVCGDMHINGEEQCDDGNRVDGDGCSASCSLEASDVGRCGDGVKDPWEECDNADANSDMLPNVCRMACRFAYCGDTVVDDGEQCDDGNDILGDGCTPTCVFSTCGNGVLELGEECDEGDRNSDNQPDSCSLLCLMPRCGDNITDPSFGEQCDDGERNSDTEPDRCRVHCVPAHCGDGVKDSAEQCDLGAMNGNDPAANCTASCMQPLCEDGSPRIDGACEPVRSAAPIEECGFWCTYWWIALILPFLPLGYRAFKLMRALADFEASY